MDGPAARRALARVAALVEVVRPANVAMTGAAIAIGARFSSGAGVAWPLASPPIARLDLPSVAALASALLIVAGGYAWNDAQDTERDRVAHPGRPVASGRLSVRAARLVGLLLLAAGSAVALAAPPTPRALLGTWAALLLAYRALADGAPSVKNPLAAALTGSALLLGGMLGPEPGRAAFPALFAFLLAWVREMVKDLADGAGDRAVGAPSWIDSMPRPRARRVVRAAIALLIVLIPVPALLLGYGPAYLGVATLGVGATLVVLWRDLGRTFAERATRAGPPPAALCRRLKGSMVAGMLALLVSRVAG